VSAMPTKWRFASTLVAAMVIAVSGCGSSHVTSSTSTTTSTSRVSFKGVSIPLPEGWKSLSAQPSAACVPAASKTIIVGDIAADGDCAPPSPSTLPYVVVHSTYPATTSTSAGLQKIGTLQGIESAKTGDQQVVDFPSQGVEINLMGVSDADTVTILNGVEVAPVG
jgi:hypothetical protein